MATEVTINNPKRSRKFGWGWTCTPTGRDAYEIETPAAPDVTGTLNQITEHICNDRTFKSIRSGGTFYNTAWFYGGKRITATWMCGLIKQADDLPHDYPENEEDFNICVEREWEDKNRAHHDANDKWGYAWFSGFHIDEGTEYGENPLKIRVAN